MARIVNVCASVALSGDIPSLPKLQEYLPGAEFSKCRKFYRLNYKLDNVTFLIYKSGSIVCLGAKSKDQIYHALCPIIDEINNIFGLRRRIKKFVVTNTVGTMKAPYKMRLDELYTAYPKGSIYEPELFNSMAHKLHGSGVTANMFASGTVNLLGAKTPEILEDAATQVLEMTKPHKCVTA